MQEGHLEPKPKGMPASAKIGLGCGIGCLVVIIILIIAGIIGFTWLKGKVSEMEAELAGLGFTNKVSGQVLEVSSPEASPTLYMGQVVKITTDIDTDVAILSQVAEIHGTVNGNVYFRGQVISIHEGGVIRGGLDVKAQVIQKAGTVEGEITGVYQAMQDTVTANVP